VTHPLDEALHWTYFGLWFLNCNSYLNVHLSLIGSRSRAFQRGIDKAPTFPLSPPKGRSRTPLRNSSAVSARAKMFNYHL